MSQHAKAIKEQRAAYLQDLGRANRRAFLARLALAMKSNSHQLEEHFGCGEKTVAKMLENLEEVRRWAAQKISTSG